MSRIPDLRLPGQQLESFSTGQLFELFELFHKTKAKAITHAILTEAWGLLFSSVYLSAEDLVAGMQKGEHLLGEEQEHLLRDFIRADCAEGGVFVLDVIRKGGRIDRAALIMVADLADLAAVETAGSTALHLLAGACDKNVRPALIARGEKKPLTTVYDSKGLPVLFTILTLTDLRKDDIKAIGQVFSRDELINVKSKNRTGRSVYEVYSEAVQRLKGHPPGDRNAFEIHRAVQNTNLRGELKSQMKPGPGAHPSSDVMGESRDEADPRKVGSRVRYGNLLTNPLDNMSELARKRVEKK